MTKEYVKGLLEFKNKHSNLSSTQLMTRYSNNTGIGSRETIQRWFELQKYIISKLYDQQKTLAPTKALKILEIKDLDKLFNMIPNDYKKS